MTKFREWKIWDCYLLRFSALFVVVYSVFSVDAFFTEKIAKQNRLFRLFWKKPKKADKYGPKRGWKIEKRFFPSHPSSSAVRAGRFGPPNFFRRRPERRLISWSPNDRFWSFSIISRPKVSHKSPVRFSTNPLASLGGLNKKVSTFEIHMKFKVLTGYIFCISMEFYIDQVCPIQCLLANSTSKQTMTISKAKNDKIAIARSICLGSFWTRKETSLNFKNWLELIWASYGKFVIFYLLKKRQNRRSSLNLPRIFSDHKRDPP